MEPVTSYYHHLTDELVIQSNKYIFKQYRELVMPNGSGDTSYSWISLYLWLLISLLACVVWTLIDKKNKNYNRIAYWFRISLRYYVIAVCSWYGIDKLLLLQMPFPNASQLATPLGDFLPMRFSWLFMGYSSHYQFFSGLMEVVAGILLLFRKTSTLGTLLAAAVFGNVMMMNLSYDIPVKLYSTHIFVMCLVLLAFDYKRLIYFFIQNKQTVPSNLYQVSFPEKWMRAAKWVLKLGFVYLMVILQTQNSFSYYKEVHSRTEIHPIKDGVYEVSKFAVNHDTIPYSYADSVRWNDVIFDKGDGSIKTTDTIFRQLYRRGYFKYKADTSKNTIEFTKTNWLMQSIPLFKLTYKIPDSNTIRLYGMIRKDSIFAELKRTSRHFQLAEKQFHWLSEYNR
jgi:hypothetical protein